MYPYIFSIEIPWFNIMLEPRFYGLFYAIAILIGSRIVLSEVKRKGLSLTEDEVMNLTLIIFLSGLLGGRFYDVIFGWIPHYQYQPFWHIFAIWQGGLAIHGGLLGGILAIYLYTQWKQIPFWQMTDIGAFVFDHGASHWALGQFYQWRSRWTDYEPLGGDHVSCRNCGASLCPRTTGASDNDL